MNGNPLYTYIINTLLDSKNIDHIVIDTNSDTIKSDVPQLFEKHMDRITIYDRPKHLWSGDTPTNDLLTNVINDLKLDADLYLQTHVTNPLLKTKTIDDAIDKFENSKNNYECLFSVKTLHTRLYNKNGEDMNHNRFKLIPTQDLDPIYEENSCIYLFTKDVLEKYKARIGEKALLFPMSDIESQDIDWEDDFIITEGLMKLGF